MKVRKMFLKPLAVFMVICMLVSLGGISGATGDVENELILHDVDCPQKAQLIINSINGGNIGVMGISPASVFCLFGHSIATGTVIMIEHRVWATSPRCRRTFFNVEYCTRSSCNYLVYSQSGTSMAIHCC